MSDSPDRVIRISTAAGMLGIDGRTLRAWLEEDRKLTIPRHGRGDSPFVAVADIQAVIATRTGADRSVELQLRRMLREVHQDAVAIGQEQIHEAPWRAGG